MCSGMSYAASGSVEGVDEIRLGIKMSVPAINGGKQFMAMWRPFQRQSVNCQHIKSSLVVQ